MAKKRIIDLSKQNLSYEEKNQIIKILNLNQQSMNLEVSIFQNNEFIKKTTIAFAHIPKKLKAKINPLC
ncbi:malate dehydrogenase [Malaciobacter molluscorum]|uniref:malate dehydrogenase n=1 Tax=Malaciobacter molluscorum TaxID=1032072 RepID=UPI00100A7094|nr:malate dehydrogenase [Malaciobacter molluscorum]RXJ93476.1 malate dehydrogenase [Malaciobacter molluscorum]